MRYPVAFILVMLLAFTVPVMSAEIHLSAQSGDLTRVKDLLAENPELLQAQDAIGSTPLHSAAYNGQDEIVKFLISRGADIHAGKINGSTPLHGAAFYNHKGATEILVRDSHGSARNILPHLLNENARLIRDWSGGPLSMMEGIDKSFDAVIFVGYHARANTPDATLDHTYSGSTYDVVLNGKKMPEAGMNAFIAGSFGVPIAMVAGDLALCKQAEELFGDVVIAPVKEGIGNAAKMMHPTKAQELIKTKTVEALKRVKDFKPFAFPPPYVLEITFKDEKRANQASWIPGAKRVSPTKVTYTSNDPIEIMKFFLVAL